MTELEKNEIKQVRELYEAMIGTPKEKGFISKTSERLNNMEKELCRVHAKFEKVEPVIRFFSHWKFISGLAVGITGFVGSILYIMFHIIRLLQTRGG